MLTVPKMPVTPEVRIGTDGQYAIDGGINLSRNEASLPYTQASNILNLNADDKGTLSKTKGLAALDTSLGPGGCTFIVFGGVIIKQWSTFLYKENLDGSVPVQIYTGLANAPATFVIFQGLLYMFNGIDFIQFDGTTVSTVVSHAYVPIVSQGRKFDGSVTTLYEDLNFLTGKFIDMFSPTGSEGTVFTMSFTNLDTTFTPTATVAGIAVTVSSYVAATGKVTLAAQPPAGTNTLKITASKTNVTDPLQVTNCTTVVEFSSRLFITGNPNYPNRLWKTGVSSNQPILQANYFPAAGYSSFDAVTGINKRMVGFIKKYDKLIYFKEDSIYITSDTTQSDGSDSFPITSINYTIGCDMPGSIQLINNMPIFFNSSNGGYAIISTTVLGENEVKDISLNINGTSLRFGLLQETVSDLQAASSYDDGSKYYLNVGNHTYVWDYSLGYNLNDQETLHWFVYDTINANNFLKINNIVCYSDSLVGRVVKQIDALNYFGNPINALWRSKLMDFSYAEWYKNITELWFTTRNNSNSTLTINYFDDNGNVIAPSIVPSSLTSSFTWSTFQWSTFTWASQKFAPTVRFKPGIKNVRYFQIEVDNNNVNEDLSIVNLVIKYILTRKVR